MVLVDLDTDHRRSSGDVLTLLSAPEMVPDPLQLDPPQLAPPQQDPLFLQSPHSREQPQPQPHHHHHPQVREYVVDTELLVDSTLTHIVLKTVIIILPTAHQMFVSVIIKYA